MTQTAPRGRRNYTPLILVVGCLVFVYIHFGGPIRTGAIFFLVPWPSWPVAHAMPGDRAPLHKGGIDLSTGLYSRTNDDLVVAGTPLVLRRTYRSRDHDTRPFGIGTTHDGELWLYPEDPQLRRVSLIMADGTRIGFDRTSSGTAVANAMFEHHDTPTPFQGARLGWTGFNWALRMPDGGLAVFQSCGPFIATVCAIVRDRDADGHATAYRRDRTGHLTRMEFGDHWIAFEYDARDRVTHASASTGAEVRYEYDARGRMTHAAASDGRDFRYTYTDQDAMATISEPDVTIENVYDENGYCIRQVTRFSDSPSPFVYDLSYHLEGKVNTATLTRRSDGSWDRVLFGADKYSTAEAFGGAGLDEIGFSYDRDPISKAIQAVAVSCVGRGGQRMGHESSVRDADVEAVKADLVRTHCRSPWRRDRRSNRHLDDVTTSAPAR